MYPRFTDQKQKILLFIADGIVIWRMFDNLPKLGKSHNAKSDTKTDTNRKTCKKKSPSETGFVNNAARWT
jgi:hypothetical protein